MSFSLTELRFFIFPQLNVACCRHLGNETERNSERRDSSGSAKTREVWVQSFITQRDPDLPRLSLLRQYIAFYHRASLYDRLVLRSFHAQKNVYIFAKLHFSFTFFEFSQTGQSRTEKSWTFQQRRDGVTRPHSTPCKNLQTSSTTKHFRCGLRPVVTLLHFFSPGDILGSSLNNLDKLLRMPYGCGEQNMINFAPNIYVMKYLKTVNQLTDQMERKAKNFMISGQC